VALCQLSYSREPAAMIHPPVAGCDRGRKCRDAGNKSRRRGAGSVCLSG
jgi:hypothetical protein